MPSQCLLPRLRRAPLAEVPPLLPAAHHPWLPGPIIPQWHCPSQLLSEHPQHRSTASAPECLTPSAPHEGLNSGSLPARRHTKELAGAGRMPRAVVVSASRCSPPTCHASPIFPMRDFHRKRRGRGTFQSLIFSCLFSTSYHSQKEG